jgi:hypothetical protein
VGVASPVASPICYSRSSLRRLALPNCTALAFRVVESSKKAWGFSGFDSCGPCCRHPRWPRANVHSLMLLVLVDVATSQCTFAICLRQMSSSRCRHKFTCLCVMVIHADVEQHTVSHESSWRFAVYPCAFVLRIRHTVNRDGMR